MGFLGSLIGAGANILGGIMGSQSQAAANHDNLMMAQDNLNFQKEMAKQGVTYRAEDATQGEKYTGINRLALLGVQPFSPSPVSAGQVGDTSMGAGVAAAGQDVERAANAMSADNVRLAQLNAKLLEAKIANVNSDTVRNQAAASKLARGPDTPGLPALFQQFSDGHGGIVTLPSAKASQAMQNWASMPAQIGVGAGEVGRSLIDAYHSLTDGWFGLGQTPHRSDTHKRLRVIVTPNMH